MQHPTPRKNPGPQLNTPRPAVQNFWYPERKGVGEKVKRNLLGFAGGVAVGLLNGLLGAGGGMVTVPLLETMGVEGKRAHATSLAVIVPLSLVSAGVYWARGWVSPGEALAFLPGGLAGALLGAKLLARANTAWVKGGFALLLLWGAARSVFS